MQAYILGVWKSANVLKACLLDHTGAGHSALNNALFCWAALGRSQLTWSEKKRLLPANPLIESICFSGSQDSEVSEEQKKEKITELKKKEKLLQEELLQKVEELKKICLREAVRPVPYIGSRVGESPSLPLDLHVEPFLFPRNWQARCPRSILWALERNLPRSGDVLARRSSWMTTCSRVKRWALQFVFSAEVGWPDRWPKLLVNNPALPWLFKRRQLLA